MPRQPGKPKKPPATNVRIPAVGTLRRYGMALGEWAELLEAQGGGCAVCLRVPPSGILCVDHLHVRGWKKMLPADRRKWVRGLLCSYCNHRFVTKGMTVEKAERVAAYLRLHAFQETP